LIARIVVETQVGRVEEKSLPGLTAQNLGAAEEMGVLVLCIQ